MLFLEKGTSFGISFFFFFFFFFFFNLYLFIDSYITTYTDTFLPLTYIWLLYYTYTLLNVIITYVQNIA